MKIKHSHIICNLLFLFTALVSCTNNENVDIKPGSYTIQKYIYAINNETDSRGIDEINQDFDDIYDPYHIYLHIVGSNDKVRIPLYETNCGGVTKCRCFRYQIDVIDNGNGEVNATLTPIDENGALMEEKLNIDSSSSCYFSSEESDIWEMSEDQILAPDTEKNPEQQHILYKTNKNTNKEIYRSENNLNISDLINKIDDLIMIRACAGFTLAGVIYDSNARPIRYESNLSKEVFQREMQSNPEEWYIKIYMGGNSLVTKFNLETMTQEDVSPNDKGYYSTGDYSEEFGNYKFIQFDEGYVGHGQYLYSGYGYCTPIESSILVPTIKQDLDIYVLIKKWEGTGSPSEEWLASDKDAVYTKVKLADERQPENGNFYILGILLDVKEFYNIWSQRMNLTSRNTNALHYFELQNAKIIYERY